MSSVVASAKTLTPEEGIEMKKIKCNIENGLLRLKRNDYFYQVHVQGELHITRKMNGYFCK